MTRLPDRKRPGSERRVIAVNAPQVAATGGGGVGFSERPTDREVLLGLMAHLDARRVLTDPIALEIAEYAIRSLREIRDLLTESLAALTEDAEANGCLRNLQQAVNSSLTVLEQGDWNERQVAVLKVRDAFVQELVHIGSQYQLEPATQLAGRLKAQPWGIGEPQEIVYIEPPPGDRT